MGDSPRNVSPKEASLCRSDRGVVAPMVIGAFALLGCTERTDLETSCDWGQTDARREDGGTVLLATSLDRGIDPRALFVSSYAVAVWRGDGSVDWYTEYDGVIDFAPTDRAEISLVLTNHGPGWVPVNLEICIQDQRDLLAFSGEGADFRDKVEIITVDDPCVHRFDDWVLLEDGAVEEFRVGAVMARDRPNENYLAGFVHAEFPLIGEVILHSLKIPYRILP